MNIWYWTIYIKQANTILVDTPGIGGSGEVTHKLKEYLPNALSFIFVINAASAGGMQEDRVNIIPIISFILVMGVIHISISYLIMHRSKILYFYLRQAKQSVLCHINGKWER